MTKIYESDVEQMAIEQLQDLGYQYVEGASLAPSEYDSERESWEDVVLPARLKQAVERINPAVSDDLQEDAIKQILHIQSPILISNNEIFHRYLTEGVPVEYHEKGQTKGDRVHLIDFDHPEQNEFLVVNQFAIQRNGVEKRPDVILFINGLPLVVMELKNPTSENATIEKAYNQIQTYKQSIPQLFTYNELLILSDGTDAKAGSLSADRSRFMAWKTADGRTEASPLLNQISTLITGMLKPETVLDLIRHFIVFQKSKKEDPHTGQITIETIKILAAYHQYYAVNKAVESTLRASGFMESGMVLPDLHTQEMQEPRIGDRKGGVIWHTQGSGKSLSMVFYAGKMILKMDNPTIVVITDRNDLDDQLFDTFAASKQLLRQDPVQAENRDHLKELLKVASGGVVFTTIQKFQPEEGNVYEQLSIRENIVVIADEAHRTQYGFKAKTIDAKDEENKIIGKKVVYGFAKYMRDALPYATYLGFTGTPIENTDVNTPRVFGHYIDIYDIQQAVEDGATVRIYYESRLARIALSEEGKRLIADLDRELALEEQDETQRAKSKWTQLEAIIGTPDRIKQVAQDIVDHFEARQAAFEGKGMIVAMSRRVAVELYDQIKAIRPQWHDDDLKRGMIKVIITTSSDDGPKLTKHQTTKDQRKMLGDRMRDPEDSLKLVIVRDMWLTGFDAPSLHTMYIDKPMRGHNLMQAIARVNRVYKDKPGGLVVDYLGIAADLKKALSFYSSSGGRGNPAEAKQTALALLMEKMEIVSQMFYGFAYETYFGAPTAEKLNLIMGAADHILSLEDGKQRFVREVTALSQAYSLATPLDKDQDRGISEKVAFFQAVKARLIKFERHGNRSREELNTVIKQVVDQALVTEQIVDIYDAAGIKKPDLSILSDEFLLEVKNMQHKNIALELLQKLLNDEIRSRSRTNLVQGRSLMEMLENSIKRYHNKVITSIEFLDHLIELAKTIAGSDQEAKELGLTPYEYAFYTAIAQNDSARELMQKEMLRELAIELFNQIRKNISIDWTIKESVKAKMRLHVKSLLRKYGYPPDMQALATETVVKQAEQLAQELSKGEAGGIH